MVYRALFSTLSVLYHRILLKIKVLGNNQLKIESGILIWNSKIKVYGNNNSILIGKDVNFKAVNIIIKGITIKLILVIM